MFYSFQLKSVPLNAKVGLKEKKMFGYLDFFGRKYLISERPLISIFKDKAKFCTFKVLI